MSDREKQVGKYYDENTPSFFRLMRRSVPRTIHQPLFRDAGTSLHEALHTSHELILDHFPKHARKILDLGCGIGESLIWFASQLPQQAQLTGITISPAQAGIARDRVAVAGFEKGIEVLEGSFLEIPKTVSHIQAAYAIESFIHADDPGRFFASVASVLDQGAVLIVMDDFLRVVPVSSMEKRILHELQIGWLANTLLTTETASEIAAKHGLHIEKVVPLSHLLRLYRFRDKVIHWISPVTRALKNHSQYCRFLLGGDARQQAYRHKLLEYSMLVFRKK